MKHFINVEGHSDIVREESSQAIINTGLKNVAAGANPMDLKRGIDKAVKVIIEDIHNQSQKVGNSYDKIEQVASISANNDNVIGGGINYPRNDSHIVREFNVLEHIPFVFMTRVGPFKGDRANICF